MAWEKVADILMKIGMALFVAGTIVAMCGLEEIYTMGMVTLYLLSIVLLAGSIAASKEALNEFLEDEELKEEEEAL